MKNIPNFNDGCYGEDDDLLCDEDTYQYIPLNTNVNNIKKVIVEFVSIYPGAKWNDLCIADIFLLGGC